MKEVLGAIALWIAMGTVGVLGIITWAQLIAFHFGEGNWFMVGVDIVFSEIIIPVAGLIGLFQLIF
jgi:hypothetical protein